MSESRDKPTISAPRGNWGSLLAAPRLISTASQPGVPSGTVLRPPQLKANNPFAKIVNEETASKEKCHDKLPLTDNKNSASDSNKDLPIDKKEEASKETVPKFLPLQSSTDSISFAGGTTVPTAPAESISANCNFVFGQNLQDRIIKSNDESNGPSNENHINHPATNGSSELLFSAAVKANTDGQTTFKKDDSGTSNQNSTSWSWVSESPTPSIPPSGPIITGEEDEDNVIQVNCRLFAFEHGQWKERGRGQLRLNDSEHGSRLLCRSAGSLRVLLNTKVWGDMTVDLASPKSLRVTATDAQQQVKVFLIMARPEEISRLSKCLQTRVAKAKLKDSSKPETSEKNSSTLPVSTIANQEVEMKKAENSSISNLEENNIEKEMDSNIVDNNHKQTNSDNKVDSNPIVIVSQDNDVSLPVKRPLEADDENISKKVCKEQPVEDKITL